MKNKVLEAIVAISLIITLTIADFIMLGTGLVTYALESNGVDFVAYFKTGEGNTDSIEYEMTNSEMKLYLEVSVKSGVSFDGEIVLGDSNFKLKQAVADAIESVEGNRINLNPIRSGNKVIIELGIEPIIEEEYELTMLNKQTTLKLTGNYDDGTDEIKAIEVEDKVTLNLVVPENIDTALAGRVLTNEKYLIGNKEVRIVQLELNTTVVNNVYPIATTTFEVELPEGVEEIEVITKGTYATNGEADRKLEGYTWDKENNVLRVIIENPDVDGKISWMQEAIDNIIVTLRLAGDIEIETEKYSVKSIIQVYSQEQEKIENEKLYNLAQSADGIITVSHESKEEIYKGKLYSKEEREYSTITKLEINYANLVKGVSIQEKAVYKTEESKYLSANAEYKFTTISKAEIEKIKAILGEKGTLTIKNETGEQLVQISKDTNIDEDIVITHKVGTKVLNIEITETVATGVIELNHTKVIEEERSEEDINKIKYLVEQATVKYNAVQNIFETENELKEIKSEVAITVPETISAEGNKEIPIAITLKTDDEKYKLFENPVFTLTMPEGVTVNSVSNGAESTLYGGLSISKLDSVSEREIRIEISGSQTEYVKSNINTQINFTANVNVEKLMANKVDTIKMQYENKGNTYQIESEQISILASNSKVVTHVKLENYDGQGGVLERYSDRNVDVNGEVQIENAEDIEATLTYTVINNYDTEISILQALEVVLEDYEGNEERLISYAEENILVKAGELGTIKLKVNIPAGLYYGDKINVLTLLEYTYSGTRHKLQNNMEVCTEGKEGFRNISTIADKIQVASFTQLGDGTAVRASDEVYNEQIISYIMEVTNISNETISNIQVTNNHDNGNIYDLKEVEVINNVISFEQVFIEHKYAELNTNEKAFDTFNLAPGESKELLCRIVAKKTKTNNITTANISISAEGVAEEDFTQISNNVKDSDVKISTENAVHEEVELYGRDRLHTLTNIKNITQEKLTNVNVKLYLSEGLTCKDTTSISVLDLKDNELDLINDIDYDKEVNCLEISLTELEPDKDITISTYMFIEAIPIENGSRADWTYAKINGVVSNIVNINAKQLESKFTVVQSVNISEGQKVKDGESFTITGEITNIGYSDVLITIEDTLPTGLQINKVELLENEEIIQSTEDYNGQYVMMIGTVKAGEKITIKIQVTVNTSLIIEKEIKNQILVMPYVGDTVASNEVTILIDSDIDNSTGLEEPDEDEPGEEQPEDGNPDDGNTDDGNPDDGKTDDENPKTYSISGYAWVDMNLNGSREIDEALQNVTVKIIDINNNNIFLKDDDAKDIEIKTDEKGKYEIKGIPEGNYNLIFKYDTSSYELKEGTQLKDYIIESTKEKVAITNNINLTKDKNVDLALVELSEFNLKIDKYISKVIVQTSNGTKTSTYEKQQLAREEIQKKYMSGATVLVEYSMEISNMGELVGYATELVDYLPNDMKFYSELNTQWYVGEDGNLYNTTLASTPINPGETKTVKLILTKTMTKENTGTASNTAEISKTMNIKGYADIDESNNKSKAEIIVNTATGEIITYVVAVLSGIIIVCIGMYIIKKKVIGKEWIK